MNWEEIILIPKNYDLYKKTPNNFAPIIEDIQHPMVSKMIVSLQETIAAKDVEISELKCPFIEVDYEEAKMLIMGNLKTKKTKGITQINVLDLIHDLHLPPEQIEKVMKKLKSKGVKEL